MNRRDLLKQISLLTGAAVVGGDFFLTGCKTQDSKAISFTPEILAYLDEIGETIIPTTDTPGAKAAEIGKFMQTFVSDCYAPDQQQVFMKGIKQLDDFSKKQVNKDFLAASPAERNKILTELSKEASTYNAALYKEQEKHPVEKNLAISYVSKLPFGGQQVHYFTMLKQLTLIGFFTSKTGMTETLRHVAVPGKYDGAVPYATGDKAWAE